MSAVCLRTSFGERRGPEPVEHAVCGAQVVARFCSPLLAPQPFAVHEMGAGELDRDTAAPEAVDRLAVQLVRDPSVAQQRP
jgi:hypothetical protein